ncbi:2-polyprenyl-3-methyl-6-methoxy-1,4-benzoquinone monooxygenase, partial [Gammaproteobacteria bacterium]|nr:2-polyprenyl-3-methyl-6-methoxy-1,4-benzoquinone monooxygenase [Gammaproteobacteria bacterium]
MNRLDNFINECDIALKTLSFKKSGTGRSYPANETSSSLSKEEKSLSAQLMRVNLAGEVAAQALYRGQAMVCKDAEIKNHLVQAGEEETDHLIWCKKRLEELNGKPSILNPVWYAGSFAIGAIFGSFGEKTSLGFVEETEKQVVKHLEKHLDKVS